MKSPLTQKSKILKKPLIPLWGAGLLLPENNGEMFVYKVCNEEIWSQLGRHT